MERQPARKINPDFKPPSVQQNIVQGRTESLRAQGRRGAEVTHIRRAASKEQRLYEDEMIAMKRTEEDGTEAYPAHPSAEEAGEDD